MNKNMEEIINRGKIKYPNLFQPIKIKDVEFPNRLFFPPWCFNWANEDGTMSDKLYDFYIDIADGGCGMIITGCAAVSPDSLLYNRSMKIYEKKHSDSFKKLCGELKSRGSVPAIQLMNFGRQSVTTWTGKPVYGPSAIPCPRKSSPKIDPDYKIKEMTYEDMERVKNDYVRAVELSLEAGFEVIQIHAANGFLLSEFISPYANKRTDQYGGSIENRTRYVVEILNEIRKKLGNDFILDIRITADEFVEGGIRPSDHKEIFPIIERAGIDMFNVGFSVSETTGSFFRQHIKKVNLDYYIDSAKELKRYSKNNLPMGFGSFISSLNVGEEKMKHDNIDFIGLGRIQVADPSIIKKSVFNKEDEINKCIYDNNCLFSFNPFGDYQVYCKVNKKYLREIVYE